MRKGYLLGSGVSCACGYPSTNQLTDAALEGSEFHFGPNEVFTNNRKLGVRIGGSAILQFVTSLLRELEFSFPDYCSKFRRRTATYEDLFSVIAQVRDFIWGKFDNPAIRPMADRLLKCADHIVSSSNDPDAGEWSGQDVILHACNYIRDVVWIKLSDCKPDRSKIEGLTSFLLDRSPHPIDIYTSNHDLLLYDELMRRGVRVETGFVDGGGGLHYWRQEAIWKSDASVRLAHLHGALTWRIFRSNRSVRPVWPDFSTLPDPPRFEEERPLILCGTVSKLLEYSLGVFSELNAALYAMLDSVDKLVISGFGFGDQGINNRVIEWFHGDAGRSILIIHHDESKLREGAGRAINRLIDDFSDSGRISIMHSRIEEADWDFLRDWLQDAN